ncbi:Nucleoside diphosphate kinase [Parasponia andersonii]|uniref:nucleoside-diphosphate kinase n=1 Tax=Parasponia andersonii TaxID=3476 RepID=A0A2P5CCW2_PARAD|nr:Nucleoside diphosphate kinase [Parasponia andersonii]
MEQTFIMIKPDGLQRGLIGEIISRYEKKGFILKGLKLISAERSLAEKHYAEHSERPFFNQLVEFISSGPIVAMVWEGKNAIATARKLIGSSNPDDSAPGTIRGDFAIDIDRAREFTHYEHSLSRNVIHGSDTVESAQREIALWFPEGTTRWQSSLHSWIYG